MGMPHFVSSHFLGIPLFRQLTFSWGIKKGVMTNQRIPTCDCACAPCFFAITRNAISPLIDRTPSSASSSLIPSGCQPCGRQRPAAATASSSQLHVLVVESSGGDIGFGLDLGVRFRFRHLIVLLLALVGHRRGLSSFFREHGGDRRARQLHVLLAHRRRLGLQEGDVQRDRLRQRREKNADSIFLSGLKSTTSCSVWGSCFKSEGIIFGILNFGGAGSGGRIRTAPSFRVTLLHSGMSESNILK